MTLALTRDCMLTSSGLIVANKGTVKNLEWCLNCGITGFANLEQLKISHEAEDECFES